MCSDTSAEAKVLTHKEFPLDPGCMAVSFISIYEWWTQALDMLEDAGAFGKEPLLYNEIGARALLETLVPMVVKEAADNTASSIAVVIELDERHQRIRVRVSDDRTAGFEEMSNPALRRLKELVERVTWDYQFINRTNPDGNRESTLTIGLPANEGMAVHAVSGPHRLSVQRYLRAGGRTEHAKLQTGRNLIDGLSGPTRRGIRDVGRMGYVDDPSKEEMRRFAERPPVDRSVGVQGVRCRSSGAPLGVGAHQPARGLLRSRRCRPRGSAIETPRRHCATTLAFRRNDVTRS